MERRTTYTVIIIIVVLLIIYLIWAGTTGAPSPTSSSTPQTSTTSSETGTTTPVSITFAGTLPCNQPNCTGMQENLVLTSSNANNTTGNYNLTDAYTGTNKPQTTETGEWSAVLGTPQDPNAVVFQLTPSGGGTVRNYLITGTSTLKILDRNRNPINSTQNLTLTRVQ